MGFVVCLAGLAPALFNHAHTIHRRNMLEWHVIDVKDGNDIDELHAAFEEAKRVKGKPTVLIANTVKGKGSSIMENKANWHHKVPTQEEYDIIMKDLKTAEEALS